VRRSRVNTRASHDQTCYTCPCFRPSKWIGLINVSWNSHVSHRIKITLFWCESRGACSDCDTTFKKTPCQNSLCAKGSDPYHPQRHRRQARHHLVALTTCNVNRDAYSISTGSQVPRLSSWRITCLHTSLWIPISASCERLWMDRYGVARVKK
jgi:hypothetical protein